MLLVCRAGKDIIGGVHGVPDIPDLPCDIVDKFLGRDTLFLCLELYFLAVFVCAGLEQNVIAVETLEACDGVGQDYLIGIADVRLAGGIGDSRIFLYSNKCTPLHNFGSIFLIYHIAAR